MTPQELKKSIIQLALKGELTNHFFNQSVDDLLKDIKQKKDELIKKGLTKKVIPTDFEENPYDLPDSWKWVKLSDIAYVTGGYAFKSTDYKDNGIRIIRISDFNENGFVNNKIVRQVYKNEYEPFLLSNNDILLCMTGGTVGKSYYVENMPEPMVTNQRVATIKIINPCKKFINYAILSPLVQKIIQDSKNSTNDNISIDLINDFPIPLPPLEEQERIVAKIEELLPLVDRYEEAWNKLDKFNRHFPVNMEKSILQYAIQGKLVEQIPSEGTGDELFNSIQDEKKILVKAGKIQKGKPLPQINQEDIPFEIPMSWKWCRWGDLSFSIQYGYNASAKEKGRIRMVRISDIQDGEVLWGSVPYCDITEDDIKTYLLEENDILFARTGGTVGKSFLVKKVPYESVYAGYLIRTRYSKLLVPEYLKAFMGTKLYWDQLHEGTIATAQPNCNGKTLSKMLIPLPPREEQMRIVNKLNELLPLCRKLIK